MKTLDKNFLFLIYALVLVFFLCACSGKKKTEIEQTENFVQIEDTNHVWYYFTDNDFVCEEWKDVCGRPNENSYI